MKVREDNILANHPAYPKILESYNMLLKEKGKVNNKKFYETVILPEIPGYHMQSWYQFLKRFRTEVGIVPTSSGPKVPASVPAAEMEVAKTLLSNSEATQRAVALALNISADALQNLMENPEQMSTKDRTELFLKVMKAQDGRVKAIGTIRADDREQQKFDHAFGGAAFS